jgi:hypothetical protein
VSYRQPAEVRSFAFGEPDGALMGTASVWDGGFCSSFGAPTLVEGSGPDEEWRLAGHGFDLTFAPVGEVAELELADAGIHSLHQLAHVHGTLALDGGEQMVDLPGQRSRRVGALDGKRFDALRSVSAWFEGGDGLAILAARPRRARGHDAEVLDGVLLEGGVPVRVAEPRLSSTYTADGVPARVGLELWLGDDEADQYTRRAAAEALGRRAVCGDPPLRSELLRWRMRGREGTGVYDLLRAQ